MHPRQCVGEADHSDSSGQCERGTAEDEHGRNDVEHVHRNLLAVRGLSISGTRNRATLTEPTKLINASAVRP